MIDDLMSQPPVVLQDIVILRSARPRKLLDHRQKLA
jgi:hypothetical protein